MNHPAATILAVAETNPLKHVLPHPFLKSPDGHWWIWDSTVGNLVLSGLIMIVLGLWLAKRIGTGPESEGNERYVTRNRFAHMIEVICVYLREETVRPLLDEKTERFMPFLWTLFFFILINNLLGLVPLYDIVGLIAQGLDAIGVHTGLLHHNHLVRSPLGGTATQNVWVTGALAMVSFFVINIAGLRELGVGHYLKHLTGGAPVYVWPILIPVELLGIFVKPAALAIRLFANMTAGHTLVATLFMFIGMVFANINVVLTPTVSIASILATSAIYFLEIFVAFLQAFIFMFLTAVFISLLRHDHDHEHEHDYIEPVPS